MAIANSKIYRVAGLSLIGFCAVSLGVDRANVGPVVSQLAGFGGAFLGALVAQRQIRSFTRPTAKEPEEMVGVGSTGKPDQGSGADAGVRLT